MRTATPLLAERMAAAGRAALPTAMTRPPNSAAASAPTATSLPHHSTWPQKTDRPRSTNGLDSASTSTQLWRNRPRPSSIWAKRGVTAIPPSVRSVHRSVPPRRAALGRPFLLYAVIPASPGSAAPAPCPNSASSVRRIFVRESIPARRGAAYK